jgi:hypothetical protein
MDNNEIMARNNGAVSALNFNPDGGDVNFHSNTGNTSTIDASGNATFAGIAAASSYKIGGVTVLQGSTNITLGSSGATGTISLSTHTSTPFKIENDDSITISSNISSSGNFVANQITASGDVQLAGVVRDITLPNSYYLDLSGTSRANNITLAGTLNNGFNAVMGKITASGNISSSGEIFGNSLKSDQYLYLGADTSFYRDGVNIIRTDDVFHANGDIHVFDRVVNRGQTSNYIEFATNKQNFNVSQATFTGDITGSGNISSSGYIKALNYVDVQTSSTGYKLSGAKIVYNENSAYVFGRGPSSTRITGSTIELSGGHVTASGNISSSGTVVGHLVPQIPKVEYYTVTSSALRAETVMELPNSLTYQTSTNGYEYLEIFSDNMRLNRTLDYSEVDSSSVRFLVSIPSESVITYKSLREI